MRKVDENEWGIEWSKVCNRTKGLSIIMSCKTVCLKSFTNSSRRWLLKRKIDSCTSSDEKLFRDEEVQKERYVFRKKLSWQNKRRYKCSWKKRSQANPVQSLLLVCSSFSWKATSQQTSLFLSNGTMLSSPVVVVGEEGVFARHGNEREREACHEQTGRGWRRRWKIRSLHFHL